MPTFRYTAVDEHGKEIQGRTEAGDEQAAVESLRRRSWLVLELAPVPVGRSDGRGGSGATRGGDGQALGLREGGDEPPVRRHLLGFVRERDRIFFFRQMALMLRSGLTLLQALQISARQTARAGLARTIDRLATSIQEGRSLSMALAGERRHFAPLTVKLVESSEATGELGPTLEEIASLLERKSQLRARLLTSLLYPAIVMVVSIVVALFLVLKVIPQFAGFFTRRNMSLPATTQALLDLSAWFQSNGIYLLAFLGLAAVALALAATTAPGRRWIDRNLLRVPMLGKLLTVASASRLTRTLSSLLKSGVTLLESLRLTQGTLGNRAFAGQVGAAADRILLGASLATGLRGAPIPALVPQVVGVGERSGALTSALDDLGQFYERELEASIRRMSAAVEPMMILIVSGMVGFVYIAFFQAVFQLVGR